MKITAFLQVRNEWQSGHLERFLKWNRELYDRLVVIDDCSTDQTVKALKLFADLLLENQFHGFRSELANKKILLEAAKHLFPETDWFLWLDADEVLFLSRAELENLITRNSLDGYDGISLPLINLWKSEFYFRTDSAFDDLKNVRLWKNTDSLKFDDTPGLHRTLHPLGLKRISIQNAYSVVHFGFSSMKLITDKFLTYKSLGQRGKYLWRLIDESNLVLEPIGERMEVLGERALDFFGSFENNQLPAKPDKSEIYDYYWMVRTEQQLTIVKAPLITLISLIYSGVDWLAFQYGELLKLSAEFGPGVVEILFVANDANPDVLEFLTSNLIPFVEAPGRKSPDEWYINSVYRGYNFGVSQAKGDWVFLTNSDMAYSNGFLRRIFAHRGVKTYLVGKLIESGRLTPDKSAIKKNLGKNIATFRRKKFLKLSQSLASSNLAAGGLFMPALLNKRKFLELGGYPEGNIKAATLEGYLRGEEYDFATPGDKLISGDTAFVLKADRNGINHLTAEDCIAYHFQEGEKSVSSTRMNQRVASGIAVANDQLIGISGERTLWNYLIEDLEKLGVKVQSVALGINRIMPYRFLFHKLWSSNKPRMIFRNATFLNRLSGPWRQVVLVQDKVNTKKILKEQIFTREHSATEITNTSDFIIDSLKNFKHHRILLPLPVNDLWSIESKQEPALISPMHIIFIGAFNETKGYAAVKKIILANPDLNYSLVSKYTDDDPGQEIASMHNVRVFRKLSTLELIKLVDESHFLLLGSPYETQCLEAMEAAMRNKPTCMRQTGILSTLPVDDRSKVGVFNNDLETGFSEMINRMGACPESFAPKEVLEKYRLDALSLRSEWTMVLCDELELSFHIPDQKNFVSALKATIPVEIKIKIKILLGRRF